MKTLTQNGLDPEFLNLDAIANELSNALKSDRKPNLPEGWKYWVSINGISAHYMDGSAGKTAFYVPTVRVASGKTEKGGFIRHPEGCCGYCGTYIKGGWECPSCGAS